MSPQTISTLRQSLDAVVDRILQRMPRVFVANEFISAYMELDPAGNAFANLHSDTFREYHTWVSRHYLHDLQRRVLITRLESQRVCYTWGGRKTKNREWRRE